MLRLVHKLIRFINTPDGGVGVEEVSSISNCEFDNTKLASPGIRQHAHHQLDQLLDGAANMVLDDTAVMTSLKALSKEINALLSVVPEAEYDALKKETSDTITYNIIIHKRKV